MGIIKQTLKVSSNSKNPVIRYGITCLQGLYKAIKFLRRISIDSNFRSIILLQLFNAKNVHQTTPFTYMDRYPLIFTACRDYFNDKHDLKILSYGCSTGEEVLTLRRYFPNAQIISADINKQSLAKCRRLSVDDKIKFVYSKYSEIQKYGPFDAIFCMGVLQRKPHYIAAKGITNIKNIYPFSKFERQIIEFDKLINPEGLLIVHYTQYSLWDTTLASKYFPLGNYNQNDYLSPVFDENCKLVRKPTQQNSIFIKL